MADPSIVDPGNSSYNLPKPDDVNSADIPQQSLDRVLPRQQSTGLARGVQQLGSPNVYVDSGNEQIIVADSAGQGFLPRVLMGNQANLGDGFYVTKDGIDVTTASNGDDFIFNSSQNVFKIVKSDTYSTNQLFTTSNPGAGQFAADTFSIATIPHDLGYVPAVIGYFLSAGNGYTPLPYTNSDAFTPTIANWFTYSIRVDSTNVYLRLDTMAYGSSSGFAGTQSFKWYLLQETAN